MLLEKRRAMMFCTVSFAEVVIYPVDLGLLEVPPDVPVERFGAREIPAEGLLEHDARPSPVSPRFIPAFPSLSTMVGKSVGDAAR
jgi:hypothetical protein